MERHDEESRSLPEREIQPGRAGAVRADRLEGEQRQDYDVPGERPSRRLEDAPTAEPAGREAVDTSPTPDQSAPVTNLPRTERTEPPERTERTERTEATKPSEPTERPPQAAQASARPTPSPSAEQPGVLGSEDTMMFQGRWEVIQGKFVDDPHAATQEADALIGEVMDRMTRLRQQHHSELRGALERGGDTEGLRVALQRYRAFFYSLLGA